MMDPFDDRLRERLERLTAAVPVAPHVQRSPVRSVRPRRSWRVALAATGLILVVSLGATAAILELNRPSSSPGAFAPGQPLHCSGVDQLAPRDAERWLAARGFQVQWQVEDRSGGTSSTGSTAPDSGSITNALALPDGTLIVIVDLSRSEPLAPRPCP
jgi:hypothetical protein